jgi:hypothetical protein
MDMCWNGEPKTNNLHLLVLFFDKILDFGCFLEAQEQTWPDKLLTIINI